MAKEKATRKRQSNLPQEISEHVWYYEEGRHLTFVVESAYLDASPGPSATVHFKVPLSKLEKSLSRSPRRGGAQ